MKRALSLLLSLLIIIGSLSLAACGEEPQSTSASSATGTTTAATKASASASESATTASGTTDKTTAGSTAGTTAASSKSTQVTTESTGSVSTEATELDGYAKHPDYADVNFGGKTFSFATCGLDCYGEWCLTYEITAEQTGNDNLINEAVIKRNTTVETLYNCKISETKCAGPAAIASDDLALGSCRCQFIMPLWANSIWSNDLYYELTSIGIDYTHDWWNQDYVDALGEVINGTMRFQTLSGYFNLITYDMIYGIFINLDLYEQLTKTGSITIDVFEEVRNGTWTIDKMLEAAVPATKDVNGNSTISVDDGDIVGLALDNGCWMPARTFYYAFGGISTTRNSEGLHCSIDANNTDISQISSIIDAVIDLHYADGACMTKESNVCKTLKNGQSLFASYYFRTMQVDLGSSETRLSVLPYPKLNEEQDRYYNYVMNRCYGVRVSKATTDPAQAAEFLEVFGFHSWKILFPDYKKYIATQCLSNEEASEMLDIIYNTLCFDIGTFASSSLEDKLANYVQTKRNTVNRAIASTASIYNSVLSTRADYVRAAIQ